MVSNSNILKTKKYLGKGYNWDFFWVFLFKPSCHLEKFFLFIVLTDLPHTRNPPIDTHTAKMHLMYTLNNEGKRVYTLKKITESGEITKSAHPARFSPDDKYSRQRVTLKKRFNLLPTQQGKL